MKGGILKLAKRIPAVDRIWSKARLKSKFQTEIALVQNQSVSNSSKSSIIHFSINKAATTHVKGVLRKMAEANGMTPVRIHDYAFASDFPFLDLLTYEEMKQYKHIFREKGYMYSVFGGLIKNIDNLDRYKIILSIRDPRDILVSLYYSLAFSHPVPPTSSDKVNDFNQGRTHAQKISIEDHFKNESSNVMSIFKKYKTELLEKYSNVEILRYESMISDYSNWLQHLSSSAGLSLSDDLKAGLMQDFNKKKVKNENKYAHTRKGVAGDYKEKISGEIIKAFNDQYKELLDFFDYSTL